MDRVPEMIGKDLSLDMAGLLDQLLDVDFRIPERRLRLGPRHLERRWKLVTAVYAPDARAAAAGHRLDVERVADLVRGAQRIRFVGDGRVGAGDDRDAGRARSLARLRLVSHTLDDTGGRPDERQPARLAGFREA